MGVFDDLGTFLIRLIKFIVVTAIVVGLFLALGVFAIAGIAIFLVMRLIATLRGKSTTQSSGPSFVFSQAEIFNHGKQQQSDAFEESNASGGRVIDAEFEVLKPTASPQDAGHTRNPK